MPSGTSARGGAALAAASVVGKRTALVLPPLHRPQDCESGIGSRSSTLRSVASSSAASAPKGPRKPTEGASAHLPGPPGDIGVQCGSSRPARCPSCAMPFDKAKKRRLIDACGHERCYSCMFANEACPLCAAARMRRPARTGRPAPLGGTSDVLLPAKKMSSTSLSSTDASTRASESALYGGVQRDSGCRPKVKTNGHFTYMKSRKQQPPPEEGIDWAQAASLKPPRSNHHATLRTFGTSTAKSSTAVCRPDPPLRMTQSCPTPPHARRKFFFNALRNPWKQHCERPGILDPGGSMDEPIPDLKGSLPLSDDTQVGEVDRRCGSTGPCRARPVARSSHSDLHVRLGLLLGDEGSGWEGAEDLRDGPVRETRSPNAGSSSGGRCSQSPSRSAATQQRGHRRGPSGCSSSMLLSSPSLASLEPSRPPHGGADGGMGGGAVRGCFSASTNTSPASTLTGSSEVDVQCRGSSRGLGSRTGPPGRGLSARDRSSDSIASLASLCSSSTSPAATNSGSQQTRRRHSVTTLQSGQVEDLDMFGVRRTSVRRSARAVTVEGPVDPKIRFAKFLGHHGQQQEGLQYQQQQLTLRPLFFEVPLPEWDAPRPLFVGRSWLLDAIASSLGLAPLSPPSRPPSLAASMSEEISASSLGISHHVKGQAQQTANMSSGHAQLLGSSGKHCNEASGVVIVGGPGTGKTALLLQLVESSCFGRNRDLSSRDQHPCNSSHPHRAEERCSLNLVSEKVRALAFHVVAYHFCQAENNSTCLVPDFVHSVAAQLCQAPQLVAYRDLLLSNPELQEMLSLPHCVADPDKAMVKGILEPLESIGPPKTDVNSLSGSYHHSVGGSFHGDVEAMQDELQGSFHNSMHSSGHGGHLADDFHRDPMGASTCDKYRDGSSTCIILVDALCEAEYHRPDHGPSLSTFLATHSQHFPSWLRLVVTARTRLADTVLAKDLPFHRISLDDVTTDDNLQRDLMEYIHFRASHSPTIRANLSLASPSAMLPQHLVPPAPSPSALPSAALCGEGGGAAVSRFAHHLLHLSAGSFLFTKLTLDLIERGHLVTKSSSYKVLPLTIAEIFLLHFNLRFHTVRAFERVLPILSVILASLCPPILAEVFYAVNALRVDRFLSWDEFMTRFKSLSGFVVKRLDDTYMFFHPAFREWLVRREEGDSNKFLCDPRIGHLGVALRLTRLQSPLEGETLLELGHHILKAHPYRGLTLRWPLCSRDLQAAWVAGVAADASRSLASLRNAHAPNVKVSRLLLLAGASANAHAEGPPGEGQEPLLCLAARRGDVEVASLLLEFGADAGLEGAAGRTPLSIAATVGHESIVSLLLHARGPGAGAGRMDPEGRSPLVHAALAGHAAIVAMLLSSDWVLGGGGSGGREVSLEEASVQALVAAAAEGHTELVEYLVDICSISPDTVDGLSGETALTAAVSCGRHSTAAALLMRGASVTLANSKGQPSLVAAVAGGTNRRPGTVCSVVELLLQVGGALPEQRDSSGRTALAHAAAQGNITLTRLLLEKGSGTQIEDREGLSALGWACLQGHTTTAKVLLDAGAQVQQADASGRTPLHLAAAAPPVQTSLSTPLVQLLLERGAVLEGVDAMGLRPLDRAVGTRNIPAVHCFLRRGARLGPATWAMAAGKPDVTLILLNKLLEDGNVLYKKGRLQEASHRYRYALKKCPTEDEALACTTVESMWAAAAAEEEGENDSSPAKLRELFDSVRVHLMLNLSRCTRKLGEYLEAVELAEGVLRLRPDSYEAHYARAKAKVDLGDVEEALLDIEEALRVVPPTSREARRVLRRVRHELEAEACPKGSNFREPCVGEDERVLEE